ncbi:CocE/NonD family hydrolase [Flavobacteriaceae bacterium TP-CH-4]|uniref:CocE/NonD family hydrolase n=1 Tax=Pelagihabitans pacificus TaxID=2696054 RepID=A0A967EBB2_9FLAO|nr:CocE/NonD family hydrolase [Pelagihabitans pacificus]NHF60181.1 CocE/NonD family hydrolase [Pelagihabitans pacificus]
MKTILQLLIFLFITSCDTENKNVSTSRIDENYLIQDVLITTQDGAKVSAIVVRNNKEEIPKPVILQSTIYVRDKGRDLKSLKESVDRGYVGVITYARGKYLSPDEIWPYENDANDTYDVIDWISKQRWCDGRIGMFGGSYNGFTQWASLKKPHPALKTIVPYVANRPGMGLPMENNVFINSNYEWAFYVGNNKHLDTIVGTDRQKFRNSMFTWWETGIAYHKRDSLDSLPNKWFQKWIKHPDFDEYWQKMAPYKEDFAKIDIPILSIDGYYNDSQNSGLYYLSEHYNYNPAAEHYLIIGPYDHLGAQRKGSKEISGYRVDPDALIDTNEITYEWFDYIFNNAKRPEKLKDKINYQVMGANKWKSASTLDSMSNNSFKFYLTNHKTNHFYSLSEKKPSENNFLYQEVDFANREIWNNDYYPGQIIRDYVDTGSGFNFISEPFENSIEVNGSFSGELKVSINKKDFDYGVTLYEMLPDGKLFHLSYIVGRASYAKDITKRELLTSNKIETIPFSNTHLVSKKIRKGSRLLVYVNVNKNPFSELNYGTGKAVRNETIKDAGQPLTVKWYCNSFVVIPIWKD